MNNKLHVGNLPLTATEDELRESFSQCGKVESIQIMKGFAFVLMATEEEATQVITNFNGAPLDGHPLKISLAKPKETR